MPGKPILGGTPGIADDLTVGQIMSIEAQSMAFLKAVKVLWGNVAQFL